MKIKIKKLEIKTDSRGWLAEIIRPEDIRNPAFGQVLVTTAHPGQIKGNHYHKRKTEWYCVIKGKGVVTISNNATGKEDKIEMGEGNMIVIEIPPNHSHSIINVGKEDLYLLAYVDEKFNPEDPDTYAA